MRVKKINRLTSILLSLLLLFSSLSLLISKVEFTKVAAQAEAAANEVYVEFYSPDNDYEVGNQTWVLWAWIPGVMDGTLESPIGSSEDFFQESKPDNKAVQFKLTMKSKAYEALKGGAQLGMVFARMEKGAESPMWPTKDMSKDRLVTVLFDSDKPTVYAIKGDGDCYNTIETAKQAFEQVLRAQFKSRNTIEFKATSEIKEDAKLHVLNGSDEEVGEASIVLDESKQGATAHLTIKDFSYIENYKIMVDGYFKSKYIDKTVLMRDMEFLDLYKYSGDDLGAICDDTRTTFKVFAPLAESVMVNIYNSGNATDKNIVNSIYMEKSDIDKGGNWPGVWAAEALENLHKKYYTYTVRTYGSDVETIDPYAMSAGVNGERGMILSHDNIKPQGWDNDTQIYNKMDSHEKPIIYELHIRDFSIAANSGIENKGKYLAFTEEDTRLLGNGDITTGIAHLKELGVNYVHLLPAFDFSSVDESKMSDINYDTRFNWGYEPLNFNVPEGSYSTDPYNGEVRVYEFKQMVKSLHDNGIGVIMDVVYNHTSSIGGSPFDKVAPSYYHRANADGYFTDGSGCSNETACERPMMGKFMRDSILYWAREYHIDGFRFDLMALHTVGVMNQIRDDLNQVYGKNNILLYGEPWAAAQGTIEGDANDSDTWPANLANWHKIDNGIASFSNTVRDGIRGEHNDRYDGTYGPFGGYVNGNLGNANMVKSGIVGGIHDSAFQHNDYVKTQSPRQQMVYASAHDNYTLWDQIVMALSYSDKEQNKLKPSDSTFNIYNDYYVDRNQLAVALMMTSKGQVFMHAGEEMARTKNGNHNSYNSPDTVNGLDYARKADFKGLFDFYKGMIALRKSLPFLTDLSYESAKNDVYMLWKISQPDGINEIWGDGHSNNVGSTIGYVVRSGNPSKREYLAVVVNPYDYPVGVCLTNINWGDSLLPNTWNLISDGDKVATLANPIKTINSTNNEAVFVVPAGEVYILSAKAF